MTRCVSIIGNSLRSAYQSTLLCTGLTYAWFVHGAYTVRGARVMTRLSGTVRDGQNPIGADFTFFCECGRVGHTQTMRPSARPQCAPLFSGSAIYGSIAALHDWLLLQKRRFCCWSCIQGKVKGKVLYGGLSRSLNNQCDVGAECEPIN